MAKDSKDYSKAPYHWRAGHGYIPPVMVKKPPAQQPPTQYFAPVPFACPPAFYTCHPVGFSYPLGPSPILARGPAFAGSGLSHALGPAPGLAVKPVSCAPPRYTPWCVGAGPAVKCKTKSRVVEPAATVTSVDSSDSDDGAESDDDGESGDASTVLTATSVSSDETLVEVRARDRDKEMRCKCREKKPRGKGECGCRGKESKDPEPKLQKKDEPARPPTRPGIGQLVTGQPCNLHIIDGSQTALSALTDRIRGKQPFKFKFRILKVQDNSTVAELIAALGGGDNGGVTQIWETGNGWWRVGSVLSRGGKKSGSRLSELGWTGAGGEKKAPVWLYMRK